MFVFEITFHCLHCRKHFVHACWRQDVIFYFIALICFVLLQHMMICFHNSWGNIFINGAAIANSNPPFFFFFFFGNLTLTDHENIGQRAVFSTHWRSHENATSNRKSKLLQDFLLHFVQTDKNWVPVHNSHASLSNIRIWW